MSPKKQRKVPRNFKVFAPKRNFNRPRYVYIIMPKKSTRIVCDLYDVTVHNKSNSPIYWRYE